MYYFVDILPQPAHIIMVFYFHQVPFSVFIEIKISKTNPSQVACTLQLGFLL